MREQAASRPPNGTSATIYSFVDEINRQLAPKLADDDATAARRAGSALAKTSAGAVYDVLKEEAHRFGEGLG